MRPRLALCLLGVAAVAAACSSSGRGSAPATSSTTGAVTTTTASTVPPTTTTTVYTPARPQPSPDAAAAALITDWASGSRAAAALVASPQAVTAVFAQPYPYSYMQPRGCTSATTNPGTCTYANRQSGALYEIGVTRFGTGWYVSSVNVES